MNVDYSDEGRKRFYSLVEGARNRVNESPPELRERMLKIIDGLIENYEKPASNYFERQKALETLRETEKKETDLQRNNINLAQKVLLDVKKPASEAQN